MDTRYRSYFSRSISTKHFVESETVKIYISLQLGDGDKVLDEGGTGVPLIPSSGVLQTLAYSFSFLAFAKDKSFYLFLLPLVGLEPTRTESTTF